MYYDDMYYGAEDAALGIVMIVSCLVVAVIFVIAWWRIFSKAGEPGWKAIIPFYNYYTMYKLFWKKAIFFVMLALGFVIFIGYMILLYGIMAMVMYGGGSGNMVAFVVGMIMVWGAAIAALVLEIILYNRLSKAFGHGAGFTVGLVLLNPVFILILAFGKSQFITNGNENVQMQEPPLSNPAEEYRYKNPMN